MIRRSLTPPVGIPAPSSGLPPTRRAGGARRNVSYRVSFFRGTTEIPGWALNISRGGLRAIVEDRIELGEELEVVITEEDMRHRGQIVWVQEEPDGMIVGVSFLERLQVTPPGVELESSADYSVQELIKELKERATLEAAEEAAAAAAAGGPGPGTKDPPR